VRDSFNSRRTIARVYEHNKHRIVSWKHVKRKKTKKFYGIDSFKLYYIYEIIIRERSCVSCVKFDSSKYVNFRKYNSDTYFSSRLKHTYFKRYIDKHLVNRLGNRPVTTVILIFSISLFARIWWYPFKIRHAIRTVFKFLKARICFVLTSETNVLNLIYTYKVID